MPPRIEQITTFNRFLKGSQARVNVIYGGAGSGKSYSVAQHILAKFLREKNKRILITRKTLPSLKITAWHVILSLLRDWQIPVEINRSEMIIRFGDNEILAKSLDDPEKIKSAEFNYVWAEEATELTKEDYLQLNLRLRRVTGKEANQIFLTFNPIDQYHWLITDLIQGKPSDDVAIHHSTYKDNKFLPAEYIRELEGLIEQDENYYRIYTLGEPGVLKNIIYTNYQIAKDWPASAETTIYGLDFGFNNPTALIEIRIRDDNLYARELIYNSGLTNAMLIERMKEMLPKNAIIYADSAEPQRIEEIRRAGFNAYPAEKEVKLGIDHVKRHKVYLHPDSANILGEFRGYCWRKDKAGRVLEEPVKFKDHAMDAIRYAVHSYFPKQAGSDRFNIVGGNRRW